MFITCILCGWRYYTLVVITSRERRERRYVLRNCALNPWLIAQYRARLIVLTSKAIQSCASSVYKWKAVRSAPDRESSIIVPGGSSEITNSTTIVTSRMVDIFICLLRFPFTSIWLFPLNVMMYTRHPPTATVIKHGRIFPKKEYIDSKDTSCALLKSRSAASCMVTFSGRVTCSSDKPYRGATQMTERSVTNKRLIRIKVFQLFLSLFCVHVRTYISRRMDSKTAIHVDNICSVFVKQAAIIFDKYTFLKSASTAVFPIKTQVAYDSINKMLTNAMAMSRKLNGLRVFFNINTLKRRPLMMTPSTLKDSPLMSWALDLLQKKMRTPKMSSMLCCSIPESVSFSKMENPEYSVPFWCSISGNWSMFFKTKSFGVTLKLIPLCLPWCDNMPQDNYIYSAEDKRQDYNKRIVFFFLLHLFLLANIWSA